MLVSRPSFIPQRAASGAAHRPLSLAGCQARPFPQFINA